MKSILKVSLCYIINVTDSDRPYKLAVNEFADVDQVEFRRQKFGLKRPLLSSKQKPTAFSGYYEYSGVALPDAVDWSVSELNVVTPVKDQGQCGSCYAFSATGALEGRIAIATKQLLSLSEQQIVDCSSEEGDEGCNGGLMDFVFQYVVANGLCSEEDYNYHAEESSECLASKCNAAVLPHEVTGYMDVRPQDKLALMEALTKGPVSVAVEADEVSFQFYKEGVLTAICGSNIDHGVLAVGYGTDTHTGVDYWLVKNSWGKSWGDGGYIKLARDVAGVGECGILQQASFPIVTAVDESKFVEIDVY